MSIILKAQAVGTVHTPEGEDQEDVQQVFHQCDLLDRDLQGVQHGALNTNMEGPRDGSTLSNALDNNSGQLVATKNRVKINHPRVARLHHQ